MTDTLGYLSLSLGEGHGSVQPTVAEPTELQKVLQDVKHHGELREHQHLMGGGREGGVGGVDGLSLVMAYQRRTAKVDL